jgi:hypothetical protein
MKIFARRVSHFANVDRMINCHNDNNGAIQLQIFKLQNEKQCLAKTFITPY